MTTGCAVDCVAPDWPAYSLRGIEASAYRARRRSAFCL